MLKVHSLKKGNSIIDEGTNIDRIYWIIEGKVRVTRVIPFTQNPGSTSLQKFQVGQPLLAGAKVVEYNLECQVLEKGGWFPALPLTGTSELNYQETLKKMLVNRYATGETSAFTFSCLEPGLLCSAPITDFLTVSPSELLLELVCKPCFTEFQLEELQQEFIENLRWKALKRHIADEYKF
jgi:CRP-like cAMP-binding protein